MQFHWRNECDSFVNTDSEYEGEGDDVMVTDDNFASDGEMEAESGKH